MKVDIYPWNSFLQTWTFSHYHLSVRQKKTDSWFQMLLYTSGVQSLKARGWAAHTQHVPTAVPTYFNEPPQWGCWGRTECHSSGHILFSLWENAALKVEPCPTAWPTAREGALVGQPRGEGCRQPLFWWDYKDRGCCIPSSVLAPALLPSTALPLPQATAPSHLTQVTLSPCPAARWCWQPVLTLWTLNEAQHHAGNEEKHRPKPTRATLWHCSQEQTLEQNDLLSKPSVRRWHWEVPRSAAALR